MSLREDLYAWAESVLRALDEYAADTISQSSHLKSGHPAPFTVWTISPWDDVKPFFCDLWPRISGGMILPLPD